MRMYTNVFTIERDPVKRESIFPFRLSDNRCVSSIGSQWDRFPNETNMTRGEKMKKTHVLVVLNI